MSSISFVNDLTFHVGYMVEKSNKWNDNVTFSPLGIAIEMCSLVTTSKKFKKNRFFKVLRTNFIEDLNNDLFSKIDTIQFKSLIACEQKSDNIVVKKPSNLFNLSLINITDNNLHDNTNKVNSWIYRLLKNKLNYKIDYMRCFLMHNSIKNTMIHVSFIGKIAWLKYGLKRSHFFSSTKNDELFLVNSIQLDFVGNYYNNQSYGYCMITIPSDNINFEAVVIFPTSNHSLNDLIKNFDSYTYGKSRCEMVTRDIRLQIPKFHVKNSFNMKKIFKSFGILYPTKLTSQFANTLDGNILKIDNVLNVSVFGINYKHTGSETVQIFNNDKHVTNLESNCLNCLSINRPFIWLIHHKPQDCIVYCCIVVDPRKSGTTIK